MHFSRFLVGALILGMSGSACLAAIEKIDSLEKLNTLRTQKKEMIIKFYWKDCGPCKTMAPLFEKLSKDPAYADLLFAELEIYDTPGLREKAWKALKLETFKGVPTFVRVAKDGSAKIIQVGGVDEATFTKLLSSKASPAHQKK